MTSMNPFFHPDAPAERYRDILAQRNDDRRAVAARRQRKAVRLRRKAMQLTSRAARLVERTNG